MEIKKYEEGKAIAIEREIEIKLFNDNEILLYFLSFLNFCCFDILHDLQ